jgi:tight adherence protein B
LAGDAGGSVASVLDGVTDTLRDRIALEREVAALSSQARASAAVLVVAPVVFAVLAAVADPRVARVLLGSPLGWACLAAGAALDGVGALWMARLVGRSR